MKLTPQSLKHLIHETLREQSSVLLEAPTPIIPMEGGDGERKDPNGNEGSMAKRELFHMSQKAQQLHDMLADEEDLPEWVQSKITKAASMMSSVFDHMMYEKRPGHVQE